MSIDKLWEKYYGWTPYQYSGNNPIMIKDISGFDWLLYNGKNIISYGGNLGDKSTVISTYKATSGFKGLIEGPKGNFFEGNAQNSKFQKLANYGPIPSGEFRINLKLDHNRIVKLDPNTKESLRNTGIEQLPKNPDGTTTSPFWGNQRARLEPDDNNDLLNRQNNFYIHDSSKGYTHGCIEVESSFFDYLLNYRKDGNSNIDLKVDYPSNNTSTNGGTQKLQ